MNRRFTLIAAASAFLVAACTPKQNVSFKGVDVTGAEYAKDFKLTDASGQVRTLGEFKGKVVVVFFGYTQCPDVCPTTMAELAEVKKSLGADGSKFQVIFVSIDPERDTPEVLKAYMGNFDPTFIALRPTMTELPEVAKAFKIHYEKVPGKTATSYTMDHSAGSYIFDPEGRVRVFTRYGTGAQAVADDVKVLLG